MLTNVTPMSCGNCGRGTFSMFKRRLDGDQPHLGFHLLVECTHCKSASVIQPVPSTIEIEFAEGSDGRLCDMPPKS